MCRPVSAVGVMPIFGWIRGLSINNFITFGKFFKQAKVKIECCSPLFGPSTNL